MKNIYQIHDNGGLPFSIEVNEVENICIVRDNYNHENIIQRFHCNKIFVGCDDSGQDLGNTLLLHIKNNEYVFIGPMIYSFVSDNPIIKYSSNIGNNDVSYPYAINENNDIFLLSEFVVIAYDEKLNERMKEYADPYAYYYDYCLITDDLGYEPPVLAKDRFFRNIVKCYIGKEECTLRYCGNFNDYYFVHDYDRKKPEISTIDAHGNKKIYTLEEFFQLLTDFGTKQSFYSLKYQTMYKDRE